MLAAAISLGNVEANRACKRYIQSSGKAEDMLCRSADNMYSRAMNGSGVFSTACTDGQAKGEAYLAKVRAGSTVFRVNQYSPIAKASAEYGARKFAKSRKPVCLYKGGLYTKYSRLAGSLRPDFGYYSMFVAYQPFLCAAKLWRSCLTRKNIFLFLSYHCVFPCASAVYHSACRIYVLCRCCSFPGYGAPGCYGSVGYDDIYCGEAAFYSGCWCTRRVDLADWVGVALLLEYGILKIYVDVNVNVGEQHYRFVPSGRECMGFINSFSRFCCSWCGYIYPVRKEKVCT